MATLKLRITVELEDVEDDGKLHDWVEWAENVLNDPRAFGAFVIDAQKVTR